jgi:hypothetical protein
MSEAKDLIYFVLRMEISRDSHFVSMFKHLIVAMALEMGQPRVRTMEEEYLLSRRNQRLGKDPSARFVK